MIWESKICWHEMQHLSREETIICKWLSALRATREGRPFHDPFSLLRHLGCRKENWFLPSHSAEAHSFPPLTFFFFFLFQAPASTHKIFRYKNLVIKFHHCKQSPLICLSPTDLPGQHEYKPTEVKWNSQSSMKNLAHNTTGCISFSLQNAQCQETDRNQINKLPTWGILFNKTLTKEDEIKKIKTIIVIISTNREQELFSPKKFDCSSKKKKKQRKKQTKTWKTTVKRADRASIWRTQKAGFMTYDLTSATIIQSRCKTDRIFDLFLGITTTGKLNSKFGLFIYIVPIQDSSGKPPS